MESSDRRLTYLFDRHFMCIASEEERLELGCLLEQPELEEAAFMLISEYGKRYDGSDAPIAENQREAILAGILRGSTKPLVHRVNFLKTTWFRYAAILLLIVGTTSLIYFNNRPQQEIITNQPTNSPIILPGGNKAILTLSDGSTIVLDSAANGSLALQGNTKILKVNAGAVAYQAGNTAGEVLYNTISTPKGGQYQIVLPDGTTVWLNAASSIRFPTDFVKERKVSISGEAYFEVVTDKMKPFSVQTNKDTITVLGTSFNVNAYQDEPASRISLLEGLVKVNNKILQPGQAYHSSKIIPANIEKEIAWKNGVFNFQNAGIEEVMRQLARWYDIEVVYEKGVPVIEFWGDLSRDLSLSEALKILEKTKVRFRLEGRTLFILP